jgi:hypothetical protein
MWISTGHRCFITLYCSHLGIRIDNSLTSLIKRPIFRRVHKISKTISFVTSVRSPARMEQLGSHWTEFNEIWYFSGKNLRKFKFHYILTWRTGTLQDGYFTGRVLYRTGTLRDDQYTFFISRSVLLRMKMFQMEAAEEIKTHTLCSMTFSSLENHAVYEIMCQNTVEPGRSQMTIRRMRIACWKTRLHAHTHST